jgi:large subunit ribosomal protein L29
MKFEEIKQKTRAELEKLLSEQREKLCTLRFDIELKKLKNVREIRKTKKIIARILTYLNQNKGQNNKLNKK